MWYFSWILGIGTAVALGILNVMWLEAEYFCKLTIDTAAREGQPPEDDPDR
jgi:cyd operon protein YbgT